MNSAIAPQALDQIFEQARTFGSWSDRPVEEMTLREIYRLASLGPTSANSCPARFVFVRSVEGKEKLAEHAFDLNKSKILAAPVTVIVGQDSRFYDEMDKLFPSRPQMAEMFRGMPPLAEVTAARNSTLQAAYLIVAARALGVDAGPMSGFDHVGVDAAFFPDGRVKSNLICSLGYGDPAGLFPRLPRLAFEDAAWFA